MTAPTPIPRKDARSHVVVLGAGASRACCLSGDVNGRILPLVADFIPTLELHDKLRTASVYVEGEDFEALYSRLVTEGGHESLLQELEADVFNYFSQLRLPAHPTIYDHLVLSLRAKDVIVTFNWDPLLIQAVRRCSAFAKPPACLFLHGNVAIGYCDRHAPMRIGTIGSNCGQCGNSLIESRLLYPVATKNYTSNPFIAASWRQVQADLKDCFLLTIFGYGAPATDVEAFSLMKQGWGNPDVRSLEETEFIDIRPEDELRKTWSPFICEHHYQTHTSYYESMIARLPRRSVEAMFGQLVDMEPIDWFPVPKDADWSELRAWIQPFRDQEVAAGE